MRNLDKRDRLDKAWVDACIPSDRLHVLPPDVTARVAVEQASTFGWDRYVGKSGRVIGMKTFGASAPLKELQRKFGFEPERVTEIAKELLGKRKNS